MPTNRRFPLPWSIEDTGAAFVVKAPESPPRVRAVES
jgi:hypothetical protein